MQQRHQMSAHVDDGQTDHRIGRRSKVSLTGPLTSAFLSRRARRFRSAVSTFCRSASAACNRATVRLRKITAVSTVTHDICRWARQRDKERHKERHRERHREKHRACARSVYVRKANALVLRWSARSTAAAAAAGGCLNDRLFFLELPAPALTSCRHPLLQMFCCCCTGGCKPRAVDCG